MREKEIAAFEPGGRAGQQCEMRRRDRAAQLLCQLILLRGAGLERRLETIRDQRRQPAVLPPRLQMGGVLKKIEEEDFVVALERQHLVQARAGDEKIEHGARRWTAIDIITEEDLDGARDRPGRAIGIDPGEDAFQCVGAAMDVADRIDSQAFWKAWQLSPRLFSEGFEHGSSSLFRSGRRSWRG